MKKVIFGLGLFIGGIIGISSILIGIAIGGVAGAGLMSNVRHLGFMLPFFIFLLYMILGIVISGRNA